MATRKVTITVDEGVLTDTDAYMQEIGQKNFSALVERALTELLVREAVASVKAQRTANPE